MTLRQQQLSGHAVCVIIAAKDAGATIARAVASALAERRVAEVVVIDDGSRDDATEKAAHSADDGSSRLRILRLAENHGPAHARNVAIDNSGSPFISILDADDFFIPGRFDALIEGEDWDFVADNILFMDERAAESLPEILAFDADPSFVSFTQFVDGNISRKGAERGEIGFLKPVIRRAFLDAHGLRYNSSLRLGEDFELYVRALALGARYKVVRHCGYGAIVRSDSLSGQHRTLDLKRLYEADRTILATMSLTKPEEDVLRRHERHIRARYELRNFLDSKAQVGLMRAGLDLMARPSAVPAVVAGISSDKWHAAKRGSRSTSSAIGRPRYLLAGRAAAQK